MDAVNTRLEDAAREMSKEMDEEDRKSKRKALMSERASKPPLENDEFQKSVLLSTCRGNVKSTEQLATVFRTDPEMQKKAVALLGWELDCIKWYPRSKLYVFCCVNACCCSDLPKNHCTLHAVFTRSSVMHVFFFD